MPTRTVPRYCDADEICVTEGQKSSRMPETRRLRPDNMVDATSTRLSSADCLMLASHKMPIGCGRQTCLRRPGKHSRPRRGPAEPGWTRERRRVLTAVDRGGNRKDHQRKMPLAMSPRRSQMQQDGLDDGLAMKQAAYTSTTSASICQPNSRAAVGRWSPGPLRPRRTMSWTAVSKLSIIRPSPSGPHRRHGPEGHVCSMARTVY